MTIFLGGSMGPIHPVWALAAIHPRWGNSIKGFDRDVFLIFPRGWISSFSHPHKCKCQEALRKGNVRDFSFRSCPSSFLR